MSPVISMTSPPAFTVSRSLSTASSSASSTSPSVVTVMEPLVPRAGSLLASFTKSKSGLFEPAQPVSFPQGIAPLQSPAPNQNPWSTSSEGLRFFGFLVLVIGFLTCMLMLVSKYWGRWEQRKAQAHAKSDEEAQAEDTTAGTQVDIKNEKKTNPIDKVSENDNEKQFVIGESDSIVVDMKNSTGLDTTCTSEPDEEDIVAFYYADYLHTTDATVSREEPGHCNTPNLVCPDAAVKEGHNEVTHGRSEVYASSYVIAATECQTLESISDEEKVITDVTGGLTLVHGEMLTESLPTVDVINYSSSEYFTKLDDGDSALDLLNAVLRDVRPEDFIIRLDDGSSIEFPIPPFDIPTTALTLYPGAKVSPSDGAATGAPHSPFTDPKPSLVSYSVQNPSESIKSNNAETNLIAKGTIACLSSGESISQLDSDEAADEGDTMDVSLSTFDSIPLNPTPPKKYASAFDTYCRERDARASASKTNDTKAMKQCSNSYVLNASTRDDMHTSATSSDRPLVPQRSPAIDSELLEAFDFVMSLSTCSPLMSLHASHSSFYDPRNVPERPAVPKASHRLKEPETSTSPIKTCRRTRSSTSVVPREAASISRQVTRESGHESLIGKRRILASHVLGTNSSSGTPSQGFKAQRPPLETVWWKNTSSEAAPLAYSQSLVAVEKNSPAPVAKPNEENKKISKSSRGNQENLPILYRGQTGPTPRRTSRVASGSARPSKRLTTQLSGAYIVPSSSTPLISRSQLSTSRRPSRVTDFR